jgi:hypothetical protein
MWETPSMRRNATAVLAVSMAMLTFSGCGYDAAEARLTAGSDDAEASSEGPLSTDTSDYGCQLVLRSLAHTGTQTISGKAWWVFEGALDVAVAAEAAGATPFVLVKNQDTTTWTKVALTRTTGAPTGYSRYAVKLVKSTVRDGLTATGLSAAKVSVSPYLLLANGSRLFDHNRVPGALDVYTLTQAAGWALAEDASVCAPPPVTLDAVLDFQNGFRTVQHGPLVAGRHVTLTYAIDRLTTCRGTHNGFPAWDLQAFVRANPSGTVLNGTVRGFNAPNGVPSNAGAIGVPFGFTVPVGTTSLDVWFENSTGAGSSCDAYDSNFGANYHFAVATSAPATLGWVGNVGSSFSRACSRVDGAPDTEVVDSYLFTRACSFVTLDAWAQGLTDVDGLGSPLFAQAEQKLDGVALEPLWLDYVGRVGNDARYQLTLPLAALYYGPKWSKYEYTLRFSVDGRTWTRDVTRTLTRDVSVCNPAWSSCTP